MNSRRWMRWMTVAVVSFIGSRGDAQLTISDPGIEMESHARVRQVSASLPDDWIKFGLNNSPLAVQLSVKVHYLMVDNETRGELYQNVGPELIKTVGSSVQPQDCEDEDDKNLTSSSCSAQTDCPSRMTTCVLNAVQAKAIQEKVTSSANSSILKSPSLILLEGKEGEMNDVIERPLLVDFRPHSSESGEIHYQPLVKSYDEGTRLRLNVYREPSAVGEASTLHLSARITSSEITDIHAEPVYGFSDEPVVLQTPMHHTKHIHASAKLTAQQWLLVDPYVSTVKNVETPTGIPILEKLPYFGRSFKRTEQIDVTEHLIFLIQPKIVAPESSTP